MAKRRLSDEEQIVIYAKVESEILDPNIRFEAHIAIAIAQYWLSKQVDFDRKWLRKRLAELKQKSENKSK